MKHILELENIVVAVVAAVAVAVAVAVAAAGAAVVVYFQQQHNTKFIIIKYDD